MSLFRFDFKTDLDGEPVGYVVIDADAPGDASRQAQKLAKDGEVAVPANLTGDEKTGARVATAGRS